MTPEGSAQGLLPCPFCGTSVAISESTGKYETERWIFCSGCGARHGYCGSADLVAKLWNRRSRPRADAADGAREAEGKVWIHANELEDIKKRAQASDKSIAETAERHAGEAEAREYREYKRAEAFKELLEWIVASVAKISGDSRLSITNGMSSTEWITKVEQSYSEAWTKPSPGSDPAARPSSSNGGGIDGRPATPPQLSAGPNPGLLAAAKAIRGGLSYDDQGIAWRISDFEMIQRLKKFDEALRQPAAPNPGLPSDEEVERVAKAIYATVVSDGAIMLPWDEADTSIRKFYYTVAKAAIAAMRVGET